MINKIWNYFFGLKKPQFHELENSNKICKLCGTNAELKESHIVPKSIYKWIKDTSATGYFRNLKNPNVRLQDGLKMYLLCENCEQKFGIYEKWFKEKIFLKAVEQNNLEPIPLTFNYDDKLFYFILSVWWRTIQFSLDDKELQQSKYWKLLLRCEKELRDYLHNNHYPKKFDKIYLVSTGYVKDAPPEYKRLNAFFTRDIRPFIMFDNESCFFSLKIPCLWFFGNLTGIDEKKIIHADISPTGGLFSTEELILKEPHILNFMQQQIHVAHEKSKEISDKQQQIILKDIQKNPKRFAESKSAEAMRLDNLRESELGKDE